MEPGESPTQTLARELREELGVDVQIGRVWEVLFHAYPDFDVLMMVYPCQIAPGQAPQCVEVAAVQWCALAQLPTYNILPADAPLIDRLTLEGIPEVEFAKALDHPH